MRWAVFISACAIAATSCSRAPESRQYEVKGQIISLNPERRELLVDHEAIEGFMPAMTMPYTVRDASLLQGKTPGDLITATLVVEEVDGYLSTITTTGHADLPAAITGPALTATDLLDAGDEVPDHPLVDQTGSARPFSALKGHRVALTFIYTRCPLPDYCPLMDKQFAEIQRTVQRTPALSDVRLVSVTLDPEYDTPEILRRHAATLGADPMLWQFLTGPPNEVAAFAKRFGVVAEAGDSPTALVHNLRTAVIGADGRVVTVQSGNMWTPAELLADLQKTPAPQR
jgi:protein SCO1/2